MIMAIEGKQVTGAIIVGVAGTVLVSCFCGGGRYCCVKEFDNDNLLGAYYG